MIRILAVGLLGAWLPCALAAADEAPKVGDTIETLHFKDIRYLPRTLDEVGEADYYVLYFMSNACPLARRYLPRIAEMEKEYLDKGVRFVGINVSPYETILEMAWHAIEFDVDFPFVKCMTGDVVKALGVTRTPEVAVLDKNMVLRYRGRVDDQYRLGGVRPEPSAEELRDALNALLAGEPVPQAETKPEGCAITLPSVPEPEFTVNYAEHIAPILQQHCVPCHMPGGGAPFALDTYRRVSGQAEMVKEVVEEERMPPWYAHPEFGEFENDRRLSDQEKLLIRQWVAHGRAEGDPELLPAPVERGESEWHIEPDKILTVRNPVAIPPTGFVPYQYLFLPHTFEHDTWIQGVEIKPSNTSVVHHANLVYTNDRFSFQTDSQFITGYVPGGVPSVLEHGRAIFIPEGAILALQVHYVTTGRPEMDQISVGLRFAKETVRKQMYYQMFQITRGLEIPPHARAQRFVSEAVMEYETTGIALFTHMHLRGRDMTFYAHYPDGTSEVLMSLPNYNFNWQLTYMYPPETKVIPAGTRLECIAHYDNSAFNPYNPDPDVTVTYGPQTVDEMFNGFYVYTRNDEDLNLRIDPNTGAALTEVAAKAE